MSFQPIVVFLVTLLMSADIVVAMTLNEIEAAFKVEVLKVNERRDHALDSLRKNYQKALKEIQVSYQKSKDLERAVLVKEEIERVIAKQWPLPELNPKIVSKVGANRKIFLRKYIEIQQKWGLGISDLADRMVKLLSQERDRLTQKGKLEEALKVEERLKMLAADPEISRARELPKRLSKSGQGRVAHILRRSGDNIEVLVRYDPAGKVSWKSPVENIIEKTGGSKERGNTKAETLGEFLGTKGFEASPFVVFEETVQSGNLDFTELFGVSRQKKVSHLGKDGVGFSIKPGVKNAYLTLSGVLAPRSAGGVHRITCEYLIPETNKKIAGFYFRHGPSVDGATFQPPFVQKKNWTTQTVESLSGSETDLLRVHFAIPTLDDFPQAEGDMIILHSLKIEHTRFSGFVVESFDENGVPVFQEFEPTSQKAIVQNGQFLSLPK